MIENWIGFDPAVLFVAIMLGFALHGDIEYAVTSDVPEDCELVTAEVVGKGRVDDGFDVNYLKVVGLVTNSDGETQDVRLIVYVNPLTYSTHEVGDRYEDLICENPQRVWELLAILLEEDWLSLWG